MPEDAGPYNALRIASETLDLLNFPKPRRHLVLNRADDKVGLTADKVETTLDMKIAQAIPTSSEVANATNAGEPITASQPKHPVSQAVMNLGRSLAPTSESVASEPSARVPAPKRGLLRRNSR